MTGTETIRMRTDFAQVVELLSRQLYGSRDAALRELLQNASDAIVRREAVQPAHEGRIAIEIDRRRRTLVFRDDGIGMNRSEITAFLAVVGASGTRRERTCFADHADEMRSESLIGSFGVGALASLQVADRIVVRTRRWRSRAGWRWEWDGSPESRLAKDDRTPVGTEVCLHVARGQDHVLDADRVAEAVVGYGDLLPCPITLRAGGRHDGLSPLNRGAAPWHEEAWAEPTEREALLRTFFEAEDPGSALAMIPVHLELPVRARGALFVPRGGAAPSVAGRLAVYVRRMRVGDHHANLLPPWAGFVTGMVESPDLLPSASRETLQHDVTFGALRDQLGARILEALNELASCSPERAGRLFDTQPSTFKSLALSEDAFFDHAGHLLPFTSNHGPVRLGDALARAQATRGRTPVRFRETPPRTPADASGPLVLDARASLDRAVLDRLASRFPGIELVAVEEEPAVPRSEALPEEEHALWQELEEEVALVLERHGVTDLPVRVERFEPASLPSLLGSGPGVLVERRLAAVAERPSWLVPALGEATGEISRERKAAVRIVLNASSPALQDLRESAAETGPLRDAAIVCLVVSALLRENALVAEAHVPALESQLRHLVTHVSRSLSLSPSLPGLSAVGAVEASR